MITRYELTTDGETGQTRMDTDEQGGWVLFSDYEKVVEYADRLVVLSDLPCLPKDLENLRNANAAFAEENFQLKNLLASLQKDAILATL